jgi:hypothetical protein
VHTLRSHMALFSIDIIGISKLNWMVLLTVHATAKYSLLSN